MAEQLFAIVFRGQLKAGVDGAEVRANFAKLFNIDATRVEQMFGGQPVIIKKGLDLLAADKYKAALAKAGAVVEVVDMPGAAAAPAPSSPNPAPVAATAPAPVKVDTRPPPTPAVTAPGVPPAIDPALARSAPPAALRGTPAALDTTLAEAGVVLVEARQVPAAAIATEHLSMSEPGVRIVDYTPPPPAHYDLANLTLAEPGVTLVEPRKVNAAKFDLSGLSLDESARP